MKYTTKLYASDYNLLAEILYVAHLHIDKDVYINLVKNLVKIFRKHDKSFNSPKFLKDCGFTDLVL